MSESSPRWLLRDSEQAAEAALLGGKAFSLWQLGRAGFPVPRWVAVRPEGVDWSESGPCCFPPSWQPVLQAALLALAPTGTLWAVRSSGIAEDGLRDSFAGQYDTFLQVPLEEVPQRIAQVWQSGRGERLRAYCRMRGVPLPSRPPTAIVQVMVPATAAGVAFSVDPVRARWEEAVVCAVRGTGEKLVSSADTGETLTIGPDGACRSRIGAPGEVSSILTDEQGKQVAALARAAANHYGRPQDIEWALAGEELFLLQSRPITSLSQTVEADGLFQLWDNSNIAESYSGITTPLTFSFARGIYESVYCEFCRLMGVAEQRIQQRHVMFANMLGLIRGRIYYNLLNWYRLLALLPGYQVNRTFMEQMMGVREALPSQLAAQIAAEVRGSAWLDAWRLLLSLAGLVRQRVFLRSTIRKFYRRLEIALAPPAKPFSAMRADELAAAYRTLERQLLRHWDAPLVNDFFAMVFFGLLRKVCARWFGREMLANDLVGGEGGIVSLEPARRIEQMARMASQHPAVLAELEREGDGIARRLRAVHPPFADLWDAYLARFGDRCLEELKLESLPLSEDPRLLQQSIALLARRQGGADHRQQRYDARASAMEKVSSALAHRPFRRLFFRWLLSQARAAVRERENLRFERTRLFGRVRTIFLEFGRRFAATGLLEKPGDVFYLTATEVLGLVEGTAVTWQTSALASLRRREFEGYRSEAAPASRFSTRGMVPIGNRFQEAEGDEAVTSAGDLWQGIPCCPGLVRAPVRVVVDPREALLQPGEILVAVRTDPGWVLLFPAASGLLVEHGSLLSHSAIVARELGLPAIVGVAGITEALHTGDEIEMDGATGLIRRWRKGTTACPPPK